MRSHDSYWMASAYDRILKRLGSMPPPHSSRETEIRDSPCPLGRPPFFMPSITLCSCSLPLLVLSTGTCFERFVQTQTTSARTYIYTHTHTSTDTNTSGAITMPWLNSRLVPSHVNPCAALVHSRFSAFYAMFFPASFNGCYLYRDVSFVRSMVHCPSSEVPQQQRVMNWRILAKVFFPFSQARERPASAEDQGLKVAALHLRFIYVRSASRLFLHPPYICYSLAEA